MLSKATRFVNRPLNLNIIINTFGSYIAVGFSFVYYLIFARIFTREELGTLGVLLSIMYVAANILDLGSTQTIYAFLPELLKERTERFYVFLKTIFLYQIVLATTAVLLLAVFFPYLDSVFFKTEATRLQMYVVATSILLFVTQNIIQNTLLAAKQVLKLNILLNISNAGRTLLLLILAFYGLSSLDNTLITIGIIGPLLFLLPIVFQKKNALFQVAQARHHIPSLNLKYTFTNLASSQIFNLALRMDLFLLAYFSLKDQLGAYSLAQKIVLSVMTAYVGITQVLSPEYALVTTKKDLHRVLKTTFTFMTIPLLAYLVILIMPDVVFSLSFTKTFSDTASITKSLAVPYIISSLIHVLLLFVLYTAKKPKYALWANIIFFVTITTSCFVLIPSLGVFAPSFALTISFLAVIVILFATSLHEYQRLPS